MYYVYIFSSLAKFIALKKNAVHIMFIIQCQKRRKQLFFLQEISNVALLFTVKTIGPVPTKDMQTLPLRSGHLCMKDAQCAETSEKRYSRFFRFSIFEYGKNLSKIDHFQYKNDYNLKNKNWKNQKYDFFFQFSRFRIFHVDLATFGMFFFYAWKTLKIFFLADWIFPWIFFVQKPAKCT